MRKFVNIYLTDEDIRFANKVFFGLRSISSHGLQSPTLRLQTPLRFFTWLRDHADPDVRDRIPIPTYANELAQTGDDKLSRAKKKDLEALLKTLADKHLISVESG